VEASALRQALPAVAGRSPLLRLQSDERLLVLIRRGHHGAFEALVQRYQSRLLAFCRHMLGSQEDAEDVLQEVFAAAFNAICADDRPINARPWLYRIARNRCLNHLRRPQAVGQDEMDLFERDGGTSTADTVHRREEFRQIVGDVHGLPETQRTALLLREIDALSYDQIAHAMDTTVPSVKSLLVRARVSLAEAAEARLLTCDEVRVELGQVAEGIAKVSPPVRRHLRACERCRIFRVELRRTSKALAAIYPVGSLLLLKKLGLAKLGFGGAAGASAGGAASGGSLAGTAGIAGSAATAAGGMTAGGALSAGIGAIASKTAAGVAAAAIVTAGAVEVRHVTQPRESAPATPAAVAAAPPAPTGGTAAPTPAPLHRVVKQDRVESTTEPAAAVAPAPVAEPVTDAPAPPPVQEEEGTVTLPPRAGEPALPPAEAPAESEHPFAPATGEQPSGESPSGEQPSGEQPPPQDQPQPLLPPPPPGS
jgi:RNA polymerase sigma factor (sigma-70 family)